MKTTVILMLILFSNTTFAEDLSIFSKGWQDYIGKLRVYFQKGKYCDLAFKSIGDDARNATPDMNNQYDNVIVGCVVGLVTGKGTINEKSVCRSTYFSAKNGSYLTGRNSIVNEIEGSCDNGGFYKLMSKPMGTKDWNTERWILSETYCKHSVFIYSEKPEYKKWLEEKSKKYFDKCKLDEATKSQAESKEKLKDKPQKKKSKKKIPPEYDH